MSDANAATSQPAGLATALLRGRLRCRTGGGRVLPFYPTAFDAELLAAVDAAITTSTPLAIVLPLPGTTVPLLLGAATLIGAVLRTRGLGVQAAVVSSNLTSRTLYDRLCFDDQRLADFMPRSSVDIDGTPRIVGKPSRDSGGRLHLASQLSRLERWQDRLEGIVIDATSATPAELEKLLALAGRHVPVVYLTADPLDPGLDHVRDANGLVWGWDAQSVAELAAPAIESRLAGAGSVAADVALLRAAGASHVSVCMPEGSERSSLDDALASLWQALARLSGAYRSTANFAYGAADATRWVWGDHNTLAMLPVSSTRYDTQIGANPYAVRLGQAPATARAYARNVGGEAARSWYAVADALDTALTAVGRQEKFARVCDWIVERVNAEAHSVLVTRNQAMAAAIAAALDESPLTPAGWQRTVKISSLSDVTSGRASCDGVTEICLPGPIPRSRSGLLAMPPAAELRILAAGPFEARRAVRQAVAARVALAAVRKETIERSASNLGVPIRSTDVDHEPAKRVRLLTAGSPTAAGDSSLLINVDNPWEPFDVDIVALLQRAVAGGGGSRDDFQAVAPARFSGAAAAATVPVFVVHLRDSQDEVLLVEPNDMLTRRRGSTVQRVAAKSLAPGDMVLLVDNAARHDLLTAVIEKLSESPTYAPLAALVSFWHARAARVYHAEVMTYREILQRMGGTSITSTQTIGNWVRGVVDGPQDPDDVRRFAIAVRDHTLRAEAERVGWALKTLHAVHRKVGQWLSAQISGAQVRSDETVIDPELGIHVSDLLESVSSRTVDSVDTSARSAPAGALGVVLPRAEAMRLLGPVS